MARRIQYVFKGKKKEISFSYDRFRDIYDAVADAEGIDLTHFYKMLEQVRMTAKKGNAVKDYRDNEFKRFGFSEIKQIKDDLIGEDQLKEQLDE